ncbi:hypothetical protein D3C80_1059040 [compost metagenome]
MIVSLLFSVVIHYLQHPQLMHETDGFHTSPLGWAPGCKGTLEPQRFSVREVAGRDAEKIDANAYN